PLHQVGHDLAHHRTELEAVAGEPGREGDLGMGRMAADDEVLVGTVLEEADLHGHGRPGCLWEVAFDEGAQDRLVRLVWLPVESIRVDALLQVVIAPDLEAGDAEHGQAVIASLPPVELPPWT